MAERVPAAEIETVVGIERHPRYHYGRITQDKVYILHSHECWGAPRPLMECEFTLALEDFDPVLWGAYAGRPIRLDIMNGQLVPFFM